VEGPAQEGEVRDEVHHRGERIEVAAFNKITFITIQYTTSCIMETWKQ
jgi:hypothetical protein